MGFLHKAVLIDRDGTMARNSGDDGGFQLLPTVTAGIKLFNENDIKVIMVVGLQPVSENPLDKRAFADIQASIFSEIALGNAHIDSVCEYPYLNNSILTTQARILSGLEQTLLAWNIDTTASYFIGDTYKDMELATTIGCGGVMVPNQLPELESLFDRKIFSKNIDFVSRDFISAARWILANTLPMADVSIVIPTKNEEHNLPHFLPYLPMSAEIVLVDGHSTDNTLNIARGLRRDVVILTQEGKGKGNALKMGFSQATRDFIIIFSTCGPGGAPGNASCQRWTALCCWPAC